jgi:hypothetical protein
MYLFVGMPASGHIKDGIAYFGNFTLDMILQGIYLQEWQLLDISKTELVILATSHWT